MHYREYKGIKLDYLKNKTNKNGLKTLGLMTLLI